MGGIVFDLGIRTAKGLIIGGFQLGLGRFGGGGLFQDRSGQIGAALDFQRGGVARAQRIARRLGHGRLADHLIQHQIPQRRIGHALRRIRPQPLPHGDHLAQRDHLAVDGGDGGAGVLRHDGQRGNTAGDQGRCGKKRFQHEIPLCGTAHPRSGERAQALTVGQPKHTSGATENARPSPFFRPK